MPGGREPARVAGRLLGQRRASTTSMGMDYERGRLLAGFAMTHIIGEGTARDAGWRYAMGSMATTVLPYTRFALSERVSAWGLAGTGAGSLTLDLDGAVAQRYRTDLAMTLAAAGVLGELWSVPEPGGFALAVKADAFWVRSESDRVAASHFGSLRRARGLRPARLRRRLHGHTERRLRTLRCGARPTVRLAADLGRRPGVRVNLDEVRREGANDAGPEHGVRLTSILRW